MKLYASPLACSAAAHLVLLELGVAHTIELVDIYAQPHVLIESGAVYRALNRKNAVPALELDSGELFTEVGVILQLLGDRSPESKLLPRLGTLERYRVMEWLSYVGSELHKTIGPLFNPAMPAPAKVLHRQKLARTLNYIEQSLATTTCLTGADFTVADAYLFVMLGWPPYFKVDLRPYPSLTSYHARISQRPSFLRMKQIIAPSLGRLNLPAFPDFDSEAGAESAGGDAGSGRVDRE
ncbi:MAG: glutathione transferase GstA [Myxococcales bacterium]|nr:MAG: glutathione transferase GstA [Myxococcales bacterium]